MTKNQKPLTQKKLNNVEADDFGFELLPNGSVSMTLGPVSIQLTFDAAHDLLFRMANFVSSVEQTQDRVLSHWPHRHLDS